MASRGRVGVGSGEHQAVATVVDLVLLFIRYASPPSLIPLSSPLHVHHSSLSLSRSTSTMVDWVDGVASNTTV